MYCIYGACACVRVCVFFLLCARVSQSIYSTIVFAMETNVTIYIHSSLFELKITIFSFFFLSFLLFFSPYPFQYPTKYFLPLSPLSKLNYYYNNINRSKRSSLATIGTLLLVEGTIKEKSGECGRKLG